MRRFQVILPCIPSDITEGALEFRTGKKTSKIPNMPTGDWLGEHRGNGLRPFRHALKIWRGRVISIREPIFWHLRSNILKSLDHLLGIAQVLLFRTKMERPDFAWLFLGGCLAFRRQPQLQGSSRLINPKIKKIVFIRQFNLE